MMKKRYQVLILAALMVIVARIPLPSAFPERLNIGLRAPVDDLQTWLITNRNDHPLFTRWFDPTSDALDTALEALEARLLSLSALTIILAVFLSAYASAGLPTALACAGCLFVIGLFGLWEKSMQTLALMLLAVAFSLLIGVPLGVAMAYDRRVERLARPLLDAMQTLPTFVYLIPALLLFGVAGVPSLVATVIYAMPPAARLTCLGLRQVPNETLEAAIAFGSTRRQTFQKVRFPMALPSIMVGVNQTIMMALSMVVICALIGADGLGREVLFALRRLRVGMAMEAGLAIVSMAVLLDRLSFALSRVSSQQPRRLTHLPAWMSCYAKTGRAALIPDPIRVSAARLSFVRRHTYLIASLIVLALLNAGLVRADLRGFPEDWRWSIREPVDNAVEWAQINLYEIEGTPFGTGPMSDFFTLNLLLPLRSLLQEQLAWPALIVLTAALAYWLASWRLTLVAVLGWLSIGAFGMWSHAMDTFSQVIVAVALSVAIGLPLGVLTARSRFVERLLRPTLDTLQTIPTFVYLVPMIMLFNLGRVPGVLASILYALPPIIRLTSLGIQQVDATVVEAAQSFGSSRWQMLYKVQIPLALPSIMLGINQTVMMVLAMVVVAGLVGGSGLGFEVVSALAENELGRGLEAGLSIVALAIMLDRLTQAWANRQPGAALPAR
jgi:glycine betaine/proline transport system permease protein